jgi:UDP-2,3-diacylglucosamine pyrophosphatase LpxH
MISPSFASSSQHTFILSDIHLSNREPPHPTNPLWKAFRQERHFIDEEFLALLRFWRARWAGAPLGGAELILNGDIFDFDSIMALPDPAGSIQATPVGHISWLEKRRGLAPEEPKSCFKIREILAAHPLWVEALREWLDAGGRVIFVIGNHDAELHWPGVQDEIRSALQLKGKSEESLRFCEWFYLSGADTLVEHGNQYDAYCVCANPIHPLIQKGGRALVRLPFGNVAGKLMLNGMGLMNPHASESFIKDSLLDYLRFYFKYVIKTQPFLLWTWFWSATVTLIQSLHEGFLPAMRDPLTVDSRIQSIARKANASVFQVLALKEVHAHPAIFNPFKILRELWLDRAFLLGFILSVSFQFFSFLNVFTQVSFLWFVFPLLLLMPCFIFYARSVISEVDALQLDFLKLAPLSAKIAGVSRIVQGHTHQEFHKQVGEIEVINTGNWSPAFFDVECEKPYGKKCFAWIFGDPSLNQPRKAQLWEWVNGQARRIDAPDPASLPNQERDKERIRSGEEGEVQVGEGICSAEVG